jgi:hypothetical protein
MSGRVSPSLATSGVEVLSSVYSMETWSTLHWALLNSYSKSVVDFAVAQRTFEHGVVTIVLPAYVRARYS